MDKSQNNFLYEHSSICYSQFYKICFSKSETNKILRYRICHYNTSHSRRIRYADIYIYEDISQDSRTTKSFFNKLDIIEDFFGVGMYSIWDSYSGGNWNYRPLECVAL